MSSRSFRKLKHRTSNQWFYWEIRIAGQIFSHYTYIRASGHVAKKKRSWCGPSAPCDLGSGCWILLHAGVLGHHPQLSHPLTDLNERWCFCDVGSWPMPVPLHMVGFYLSCLQCSCLPNTYLPTYLPEPGYECLLYIIHRGKHQNWGVLVRFQKLILDRL